MPNSVRQQIMVAVISSLTGITTANGYVTSVHTCSENLKSYEELGVGDLPACFPIDTGEVKAAFVMYSSATDDMQSTLTVLVTSYVFDRDNATTQARCDLLRDVEKALVNSTAMAAVTAIIAIRPTRVVTDMGTIQNYSIFDQEFEIDYLYSHEDGG